jgi:hypothetical protein
MPAAGIFVIVLGLCLIAAGAYSIHKQRTTVPNEADRKYMVSVVSIISGVGMLIGGIYMMASGPSVANIKANRNLSIEERKALLSETRQKVNLANAQREAANKLSTMD